MLRYIDTDHRMHSFQIRISPNALERDDRLAVIIAPSVMRAPECLFMGLQSSTELIIASAPPIS